MATLQNNMLLDGIRGMFGSSIVFRNVGGKTIVSPRPTTPRKQSAQQRANRSKFRDASNWAQLTLLNSEKKEYYKKKAKKLNLPNAYTAAIADYMRKPKVTQSYSQPEGTNYCVVKKNFALKKVEITVTKDGVSKTRMACNFYAGEWGFLLTPEEQRSCISVRMTDDADQVYDYVLPTLK